MNKRKRHVADVAFELFVEKGVQQTSIQDIIEQAKISKGTFYNYFPTKNDCIAEILEGLRYDASQLRIELQVGRDETDPQVLIEQISILIRLNEERNISKLFEAILSSNEPDLKKLALKHRLYEIEWISDRFIEVYGEQIRSHAFELSVLFGGMLQYVLFINRMSNHTSPIDHIVGTLLSYIDILIPKMIEDNKRLLNEASIDFLRSKIDRKVVTMEEIMEQAEKIEKEFKFTIDQRDLFEMIVSELKRERIRKSIIQPLLKPFLQAFDQSPNQSQIKTFVQLIWYFLKVIQ